MDEILMFLVIVMAILVGVATIVEIAKQRRKINDLLDKNNSLALQIGDLEQQLRHREADDMQFKYTERTFLNTVNNKLADVTKMLNKREREIER